MRLMAYRKHLFTADVWEFNFIETNPGGVDNLQIFNYYFLESIALTIGGSGAEVLTILTDKPYRQFVQFRNIKDRAGVSLEATDPRFDERFYIAATWPEPELSALGFVEGYTTTLNRSTPVAED